MQRYYITDRAGVGGSVEALLTSIERNVAAGVDFIQIREKDLNARALLDLARSAVAAASSATTRVLVNGRVDIALAAGAHGVHLPSNSPVPALWRRIVPPHFLIGVSCHTLDDIAAAHGADFIVYGPVFATPGKGAPVGIEGLSRAVAAASMPVFALGGIDESNAADCVRAGAAGIAAIRLFQRSL